MDDLWLSAPGLALRLLAPSDKAQDWLLNPAANLWTQKQRIRSMHWSVLAAELRAELSKPAAKAKGTAVLGSSAIEFHWNAVAMAEGWLVWLDVTVSQVQHLQDQLNRLQELGRMGAWDIDLLHGHTTWNTQMFMLMGFDECDGTPSHEVFMRRVHPDDRALVQADFDKCFHHVGPYRTRYRVVLPDNQVRDIHSLCYAYPGPDGTTTRIAGVAIDDTENVSLVRKAERKAAQWFRTVDQARVSVWRLDLLTARAYYTDWGYRALGVEPTPDGLSIDQVRAAIHPDDRVAVEAAAKEAIVSGRIIDVQARYVQTPGHYNHMLTRWVAERDADGKAVALTGVALDITEQKRIEQALREQEAGEHAQRTRNEFFSRMSHKLRTPLNAVLGFTQLLQTDSTQTLSAQQQEHVGRIHASGLRLLDLVNEVLAVAAAPRIDISAASQAVELGRLTDGPRVSLLYIEDNPVNVLLVQELVAQCPQVRMSVAVNGIAGVAQAQKERPDIVLLDMQLPDIDGFEVLRRLRALNELSCVAIVALSANAMSEDVDRARAAGFDDYWTKPIQFDAFLRGLNRLVERCVA